LHKAIATSTISVQRCDGLYASIVKYKVHYLAICIYNTRWADGVYNVASKLLIAIAGLLVRAQTETLLDVTVFTHYGDRAYSVHAFDMHAEMDRDL
jgi:hypothetical protein